MTDHMDEETLTMLRKAFAMFEKDGFIATEKMSGILTDLGQSFEEEELGDCIKTIDTSDEGKVNFDNFVAIVCNFFEEEDDPAAMQEELKEAFRLYDKEGNGYITTGTLKEILKELDNKLSEEELEGMIEEIDEDGSGTVDFDEFMNMMTGE